jgi:hypothetical protein
LPGSKENTAHSTIVSGYVPRQLADELRRLAAAGERSISGELRIAIREHLALSASRGDEATRGPQHA